MKQFNSTTKRIILHQYRPTWRLINILDLCRYARAYITTTISMQCLVSAKKTRTVYSKKYPGRSVTHRLYKAIGQACLVLGTRHWESFGLLAQRFLPSLLLHGPGTQLHQNYNTYLHPLRVAHSGMGQYCQAPLQYGQLQPGSLKRFCLVGIKLEYLQRPSLHPIPAQQRQGK